ncbi:MAG: hypothetical protein IH591_04200 [Bacteroidales bacterium]|nr:hypothetical protein [Bacteroidales bacterium]
MKKLLLILTFLVPLATFAQEPSNPSDTLRKDALNVFMDASDYIRKEISFVNYVRDIRDAHVYIISSYRRTGSGGSEVSYFIVGQREYAGMADTIIVNTGPDDTDDIRRQKEVNGLKMGLVRYVMKTPLASFIDVRFNIPVSETVSTDQWNSWVFRSSIGGFLQGQKTYSSSNIFTSISANRVTENMKTEMSLSYDRGEDSFDLGESIITSLNQSKDINIMNVWAINSHWSYGGSISLGSSSYGNSDLSINILPGIEYNIFPYSESTRRQLRMMYRAGFEYQNYTDSTIYDKLEEKLLMHSFSAAYQVVQKWGSVNLNLNWRNYLHDFSKNNFGLSGSVNLRVAKGLSVNFGGSYSIVHDQLGLVKGGATPEEILLRRRELATQYSYFSSFGFSYTFGSIYNNVVNPRFGGGGGSRMIISF